MDLEQRHLREKEFHNLKADDNTCTDFYAWGVLNKADRYAYDLLGDLQGKVLLDLGCGSGHHAVRFAEKGAMVYAIDLSSGMVEMTKSSVKECSDPQKLDTFQALFSSTSRARTCSARH